jgi:hypothetical protein
VKKKADEKDKEKEEEESKVTDVTYLKGQQGVPDFWFKAMKNS